MRKQFDRFAYKMLVERGIFSDGERYLYLFIVPTMIFAALIHLVMIPFFVVAGFPLFVWINVGSVCCYVINILIIQMGHYDIAGYILAAEVSVYTILSTYFFGVSNFVILYPILVVGAQISIPYQKASVRIGVGVSQFILTIFLFVMDIKMGCIYELGRYENFARIFNLEITLIGLVILFTLGFLINFYLKQFNAELLEKYKSDADRDVLTGLPNRRGVDELAEEIFRSGEAWYVAMLDVDDFKQMNDRYGHQIGDEVLKKVAEVMRENVRKTDRVFRWGGEEFLIFLRDVTDIEAFEIYEKVRKEIEKTTVEIGKSKIHVTVTIGATPLENRDMKGSIAQSDKRLYQGKNEGKNQVVMP